MDHLLIKISLKNSQHPILVDSNYGKDFLCDWVQMNKMTLIYQPVMHVFDKQIVDITQTGGYSGIALLRESHTSIHTYPENNNKKFIDEYIKLTESELNVDIQLINRN